MTTPTFTWSVNTNATPTIGYATRTSKFGDGYVATAGEGVNNKQEAWEITWIGSFADCTTITTMFDTLAGYKSFYWTNPLQQIGLYKCQNPTPVELGGNTWQITGTFTKAYAA